MQHTYSALLMLLISFTSIQKSYAQIGHGFSSKSRQLQTAKQNSKYLIDQTQHHSKDDRLELKANFTRGFGYWRVSIWFLQESKNKVEHIEITDFERVDGKNNQWQNGSEIWLYGRTYRLRTIIDEELRSFNVIVEDPEFDTRQGGDILGYNALMHGSAIY